MSQPLAGVSVESLHASLLLSVSAGIAAVDDDGVQIYVNPAFAEMVGWSIDELVGRRAPYPYWPPEEVERILAAFRETIGGRPGEDGYELRFMRRDGLRFDVLVTPRPLVQGGRRIGWVASVKDLTVRKTLERERDRAAANQRLLARASEVLSSSLDYEKTLSALARLVVPALADYCLIDLVEPDGALRRVEIADTDPERAQRLREMGRRWPASLQAELGPGFVTRTGQSVLAPHIADEMFTRYTSDPERLAIFRSLGLRSCIIAPIRARGRVLGALTLNSTSADRIFDDTDLALAESLGERAGLAIDNAMLYTAEQNTAFRAKQVAQRIERLQALTEALSGAATVEEVASAALHHGMAALGAIAGGVTLLEPDALHQRVVALHVEGVPTPIIESWRVFPIGARYPVNDALRERRMIRLSRAEYVRDYPELASQVADVAFESYVAAPLEIEGRAIGCINYNFPEPREFDASDIALIVAVSRQASLAFERARLFESESRARARAEEANLAKSRFLATMSHELRTPLNAVLGFVELLRTEIDGPLNPGQHQKLERVAGASQHLIGVIDEILTFARLEAQREQVRRAECDVGEVVRDAIVLLESQAHQAGIALRLDVPAGIRAELDAGKVRQIVLNLLGNALKFTGRGEVGVELREGADAVRISVWDTGPGIPDSHHERIFEPFSQLDDSITRRAGGTGLGLTVSRGLARLMGGDLRVSTREGGGSLFELTLPRGV